MVHLNQNPDHSGNDVTGQAVSLRSCFSAGQIPGTQLPNAIFAHHYQTKRQDLRFT